MYNEILTIGPITVHGYGLMIGVGIIAALLMGEYRAKKFGLDGDRIYGLTFATVLFGFLAARVLFIITEWNNFIANPLKFVSGNGFVVYGGIIGGTITIFTYCKLKKMDIFSYLDLLVPSIATAQGFGRIGCFLAGCCYGRKTESPFGVVFTNSDFAPNGIKLLPTQLFMSAGDFVIMAILLWYASKRPAKGKVSCLYLFLYSIGRFGIEFLRNDDRGTVGVLSTSQFIAIFTATAAVIVYMAVIPRLQKKEAGNGTREH